MNNKRTKDRARATPSVDKPVNWSRLRQIFSHLTYRRQPIMDGLVFGPVVDAQTPEELAKMTDESHRRRDPETEAGVMRPSARTARL